MDVFSLRDSVVGEYKKFATSFTTIFAEDLRRQIDAIYADERYWPEPLIQVNPNFQRVTTVEKLVTDELLEREYRTKRVILEIHDDMAEAFPSGKPYRTRLDPPPADASCAHPESPRRNPRGRKEKCV